MRIQELLEAPLPDNYDKAIFTPKTSYNKRIDYMVAQAQKLGKGSSRTAFTIEYKGRPTILKIAHNKKGMAQNAVESSILEDNYVESMGITIPIIDYDEEHDEPIWIHMEQASKASPKQLCDIMKCGSLSNLISIANYRIGKNRNSPDSIYRDLTDKYKCELHRAKDPELLFNYHR